MKTMFKTMTALVLSLCVAGVSLASNPEVSVVSAGKKSIAVYLSSEQTESVSIRLKDPNGTILLTDRVKSAEDFARKYNLANLPAGEYFLYVDEINRTTIQPVTLTAEEAQVSAASRVDLFSPAVALNQSRVDYTLLCLAEMPVTIEILDELGRTNYHATSAEKGSVQRRFDITQLTPGSYQIVTTLRGEGFTQKYSETFTVGEVVAGH